jgi:preprotein translocase subunit SecA
MQLNLKEDIVELLFRAEIAPADFEFDDYNMLDEYDTLKDEFNAYGDNASGPIRKGSPKRKSKGQIIKHERIGRNDPCPCGSGKKYKQCCGK